MEGGSPEARGLPVKKDTRAGRWADMRMSSVCMMACYDGWSCRRRSLALLRESDMDLVGIFATYAELSGLVCIP